MLNKFLYIKKFADNWVGSLDNHSQSFSARKLSAIIIMTCVVFAHISWLKHAYLKEDFKLLESILIIDYTFILLALGIITLEQVIKLKQGQSTKDKKEVTKDETINKPIG